MRGMGDSMIAAGRHSLAAWIHPLRLGTGLVLLTYVTTHLLNHALGLISLAAMETGRDWFLLLWRGRLVTVLLYGSLVTHILLALWSLYQRRHLRMPTWEAVQLVLGLCVPPLLAGHIVGSRLAYEWFGFNDSYTMVLLGLRALQPERGVRQAIVLLTDGWSTSGEYADLLRRMKAGSGLLILSMLYMTSSAVSSPQPSWNWMPLRRWKV